MGLNARVTDASTGNIVLTETPPSRDVRIPSSKVEGDAAAAREAVRQLMEGSPKLKDSDAGWSIIRHIFAHWAAEKDLGALFKMEFTGLDLAAAEKLKEGISGRLEMGGVWVRSVDPAGVSVLECESRVDALALAKVIESVLPGYKLDRSDSRYLSFRTQGSKALPSSVQDADEQAAAAADSSEKGKEEGEGGLGSLLTILASLTTILTPVCAMVGVKIRKNRAIAK